MKKAVLPKKLISVVEHEVEQATAKKSEAEAALA